MLIILSSILFTFQASAESEGAKKAIAEIANTPTAKAGKVLTDCLMADAEKAKSNNVSNEEFQRTLNGSCPDETRKAREALTEAMGLKNSDQGLDDKATDFGIFAIRLRVYQTYTGVAKLKTRTR